MQKYNSNFVSGMSEYFVTEACEYKESFLHIQHDVLLITNITEDHLDYFDDLNHIKKAFESFLDNKKGEGILVCNTALPELFNTIEAAHALGMKVINYAKYLDDQLVLPIPGEHNRQNAAAALGIVEALDLSIEESRNYLARQFQGAKRRMEHVGMTNGGAQLFDDYAHNPEGLDYLVKGLREFYPEKQIVMLFEPHLYSRTRDFLKEFGQSLENVDVLYLFPTYRAREVHIPEEDYLLSEHISAEKVELIVVENKSRFKELFETKGYGVDTVVITVGAGDIWQQGLEIKKNN
jgi:UDP-N-acetylmuramate--alanine ligase